MRSALFQMKDPLRIVQVGMGFWGRDWARMVIPEVDDVELVACVDSDAQALALLQEQMGISSGRCFSGLEAALDAFGADAVLKTTTLPGHAPVTRAALEAGLHVLVEKPFDETLECAQGLVELAAGSGAPVIVSQYVPFFHTWRKHD